MLKFKETSSPIRTLHGWATLVLQEAGAIRECATHGWMQDRADPHALERAFETAGRDPPFGLSGTEAQAAIEDVVSGIGDSCPECPPEE
jgi:hypothetical protein